MVAGLCSLFLASYVIYLGSWSKGSAACCGIYYSSYLLYILQAISTQTSIYIYIHIMFTFQLKTMDDIMLTTSIGLCDPFPYILSTFKNVMLKRKKINTLYYHLVSRHQFLLFQLRQLFLSFPFVLSFFSLLCKHVLFRRIYIRLMKLVFAFYFT